MSSPMSLPANAGDAAKALNYEFDTLVVLTSTLLALSTLAVGLRVWVRTCVTRTFGWDDATMIGAWFAYLVTAILCYIATYAERIVVDSGKLVFSMGTLVNLIKYGNAGYAVTMIIVKISIGIFFIKLFATSFKWQRMLIFALMAVSTAMGVAYLIMTFATCGIMVQSQKTTPMHTGTDWCPIQQTFVNVSIAWSVMNSIIDIVYTSMAIQVLWNAQLNLRTKIPAAILILLGSVGVVASIARITVQTPLGDIRLAGVLLGIWSNTEAGICITAGSLITLRPLFQGIVDKARSTFSSLSKGSRSSSNASAPSSSKCLSTDKSYEDIDLEKGANKDMLKVTRTWEVEADSDSWSKAS